jgi:hypothetical protein
VSIFILKEKAGEELRPTATTQFFFMQLGFMPKDKEAVLLFHSAYLYRACYGNAQIHVNPCISKKKKKKTLDKLDILLHHTSLRYLYMTMERING